MVRHGESEGNVDKTLFERKPDNMHSLTQTGAEQAREVSARASIFVCKEAR